MSANPQGGSEIEGIQLGRSDNQGISSQLSLPTVSPFIIIGIRRPIVVTSVDRSVHAAAARERFALDCFLLLLIELNSDGTRDRYFSSSEPETPSPAFCSAMTGGLAFGRRVGGGRRGATHGARGACSAEGYQAGLQSFLGDQAVVGSRGRRTHAS
jgi:hypothetical protein